MVDREESNKKIVILLSLLLSVISLISSYSWYNCNNNELIDNPLNGVWYITTGLFVLLCWDPIAFGLSTLMYICTWIATYVIIHNTATTTTTTTTTTLENNDEMCSETLPFVVSTAGMAMSSFITCAWFGLISMLLCNICKRKYRERRNQTVDFTNITQPSKVETV
jgi:hypothetical protein